MISTLSNLFFWYSPLMMLRNVLYNLAHYIYSLFFVIHQTISPPTPVLPDTGVVSVLSECVQHAQDVYNTVHIPLWWWIGGPSVATMIGTMCGVWVTDKSPNGQHLIWVVCTWICMFVFGTPIVLYVSLDVFPPTVLDYRCPVRTIVELGTFLLVWYSCTRCALVRCFRLSQTNMVRFVCCFAYGITLGPIVLSTVYDNMSPFVYYTWVHACLTGYSIYMYRSLALG